MDRILAKFCKSGIKSGTNSYVLILDIDHFKRVNDNWGHQKGDEILVEIAEEINHSVRSTDFTFRYGGEEFLVLLTDSGDKKALFIAERIRTKVELLYLDDKDLTITISGGLVALNGDAPDTAVKRADTCLYQAKSRGRNQIVMEN